MVGGIRALVAGCAGTERKGVKLVRLRWVAGEKVLRSPWRSPAALDCRIDCARVDRM